MKIDSKVLAWHKSQGLLPAIVQDAETNAILMLGYMNKEALEQTIQSQWVTFYSRSKQRLWVKGETSGHKLKLIDIKTDCDQDSLLIKAIPLGPTCHTGSATCFGKLEEFDWNFLSQLEAIIQKRYLQRPEKSYTTELFNSGISRIAQKVGEEGVEVALGAIEKNDEALCGEIADLLFHVLVLLRARNLTRVDVIKILKDRHKKINESV